MDHTLSRVTPFTINGTMVHNGCTVHTWVGDIKARFSRTVSQALDRSSQTLEVIPRRTPPMAVLDQVTPTLMHKVICSGHSSKDHQRPPPFHNSNRDPQRRPRTRTHLVRKALLDNAASMNQWLPCIDHRGTFLGIIAMLTYTPLHFVGLRV